MNEILVWSIGGLIVTGENWSTHITAYPIATLSITNDTWTSLHLNLGPFGESLVCNNLSNDMFQNVWGYTSILPYIFMM
jgi:uncharacterized membrane protein YccF (DUF307 family)